MNLLTNAVKFTPANGTISLKMTVDPDAGLRIEVADTGVGIREHDLERVLHPFEQAVDETYSRSIEGAGLGLYLSRAFAQAHDGELSIASEIGKGTTVTVFFPSSRLKEQSESDT